MLIPPRQQPNVSQLGGKVEYSRKINEGTTSSIYLKPSS